MGLFGEILLSTSGHPWVYFGLTFGADFATWQVKEEITINNNTSEDGVKFEATCPFLEPAFKFKWHLNRKIAIVVRPAYHITLGGKYHMISDKEAESDQTPGWKGPRISFNLEYGLFKQSVSEKNE